MKFLNGQTLEDGVNLALGTTTGTKIGTSTSQKLGFFNSAPIVQPTGNVLTALQNLGLGSSLTVVATALTGIVPIANGGTNQSSLITVSTPSAIVAQDANGNYAANNILYNVESTVTGAGTWTLTAASAHIQTFSGSTTHTIVMPVKSTLVLGQNWYIVNDSTGILTFNSSGGSLIGTVLPGHRAFVTTMSTSGTSAAGWNITPIPVFATTNTGNTAVLRDASGNFSAGTITAALTGNASTATSAATLTTPRSINGVSFNGSADILLNGVWNNQTGTTYTFVLTDNQKPVSFSNASTITATVPPNASVNFPTGAKIDVIQIGAGKLTIAAGAGVTILSQASNKSAAAQYVGLTLLQSSTINTWYLVGNLIP